MATRTNNKRSKLVQSTTTKADNWAVDNRFGQLGVELATKAVQAVSEAGTLWDRCRTLYCEAQEHGKQEDAIAAIFGPGEKVKGKKAPWYRTYKSLLTNANKLHVTVTNDMGMTALQKAIKASKAEAEEQDEEQGEAKVAQLKGMFINFAKALLERGVTKAELAKLLKDVEV